MTMKIILGFTSIVLLAGLIAIVVIPWACVDNRPQAKVVGPPCFPDISNCDISGTYTLSSADVSPYVYSISLPIAQDDLPTTEVALAPVIYFYGSPNSYIFRSVGSGTWDGDSLKATIHGKLRLNGSNYPVVGGFSITLKLDAKQKTFTSAYYYSNLTRMILPALDGMMTVSDSAHVIFPVTNTTARAMFIQL